MVEEDSRPGRGPVQCSASVTLAGAERRSLTAWPGGMSVPNWHLDCALEEAHEGSHFALGQSQDGDLERWVRWEDRHLGQLDFVDLDACPYRGDSNELCHLFTGHPGTHALAGHAWQTDPNYAPPPHPARSHADYLAHRRAALTSATTETAQLHASLALAAATNRLADLLEKDDRR